MAKILDSSLKESSKEYYNNDNHALVVHRLGHIRYINFWNMPNNLLSQITLDDIDRPGVNNINILVNDRASEGSSDHFTMVYITLQGKIEANHQSSNLQGFGFYLAK